MGIDLSNVELSLSISRYLYEKKEKINHEGQGDGVRLL